MCDFTSFQPPEMTKTRRVIILSPRSRTHFPDTFLVVPVSKSRPSKQENHHFEFRPRAYAFFDAVEPVWALANMLTCVKKSRLDRMKINNRFSGAQIRKEDLQGVRRAVLHAMGMENWQQQVLDREAVEAAIGMTSESQFD